MIMQVDKARLDEMLPDDEHLTEYEVQVLLGTTIHGCNMPPDRVFSLDMAWHRLYAIGLIDRSDGLAIATDKGRAVVARVLRSLRSTEGKEGANGRA